MSCSNCDDRHGQNQLQVPEYQSDNSGSSSDEQDVVTKRKKQWMDWIFVKKFDNCIEAEGAVAEEGAWSLHYYHETSDGKKKYYRCNKLKKRGPQCSARIYLLFETTSDSVLMFRTDADHDHDKKMEFSSSYGLSDTVKSEIDKLFELKMKPKAIMQHLTKMKDIQIPKYSQLKNFLNERRRLKYVVPPAEATNIPIGEKRKRGRPSKAKRALIIQ